MGVVKIGMGIGIDKFYKNNSDYGYFIFIDENDYYIVNDNKYLNIEEKFIKIPKEYNNKNQNIYINKSNENKSKPIPIPQSY